MITLAMVGMIGLVATVLLPDEPVPQGSTTT
jgi:hypothetical protein